MARTSRRKFLQQTGIGVAGVATLKLNTLAAAPGRQAAPIPPHQELEVFGVHAYPTEHSVAAGETLSLHVSSTVPYELAICRLGSKVDDPQGDEVLHRFPRAQAEHHAIHPGSYVQVEKGLPRALKAVTFECWVRPWRVTAYAGLVTQYDYKNACGAGLFLMPGGALSFYLGDGKEYHQSCAHQSGKDVVKAGQWYHVVAAWDGGTKTLSINGKPAGSWPFAEAVQPGSAPLRLASYGEHGAADKFLDGDLAMCAVYERALTAAEVKERFEQRGLRAAKGADVLACWNFAEEKGERVADVSRHGRHGRIINHATWMIGGPSFDANVPRFGQYEPPADASRGHGLRFASDDLYDCRWPVRHQFRVPPQAKPGIYVARFTYDYEGKPREYDVTFIVRKPKGRKKAPILMVCAANTWRAYSGTQFAIAPPGLKHVWGTRGLKNAPNNPPAFNLYSVHAAGQGTYQVGLRMPWPAASPYVLYGGATDYSHLMRADRFAHAWLEQAGYEFDVISDVDLHRDPKILQGYRTFIINGHNEYWSLEMFGGLEDYLKRGGNVIVLSGNTLFWRVSFNDDCTVMECRKVDAPGMQVPAARRGEAWHSGDGLRGGMMRECGWPGWKLIGLDSLGWNNQSKADNFGPWIAEEVDHFLFHMPEETGLKRGDRFGEAPGGKMPMANGHEFDVRPSTLAKLQEQPDPEGAHVPPDPAGILRLANGIIPWAKGGAPFDYYFRPIKPKIDQGGEMIFWVRPEGGKVFNAGTIGAGWALFADPRWQTLLRNVLAHFGVKPPIVRA
ncbi:MAG: LamG domain-containing protein [Verrucomicrobiota bacterium]